MNRANAWFDHLSQQGKAKAGQPLAHEGKIVSGKKGRIVTDGPFAESKEAIAGYVLLQVDDLDEAVEIAKQWPILEIYDVSIEVRPVNARERQSSSGGGLPLGSNGHKVKAELRQRK